VLRPILAGADAILNNGARHRNAICAAWFRHATATSRRQRQGKLESDTCRRRHLGGSAGCRTPVQMRLTEADTRISLPLGHRVSGGV